MSDDIIPHKGAPDPPNSGVQVLQKIGVLSAKAAFSSIPWAALVFDVGQTAVEFGYARQTERLFTSIGDRIDKLEDRARARLKEDEVYQLSAQAAIRRMLMETNPRMAEALARAVVELGVSDREPAERMEIARALDVLTEPALHLLQTQYRVQHSLLTEPELEVFQSDFAKPYRFNALLAASMPRISWLAPSNDLERAGLIEATLDNTTFAEAHEATKASRGQVAHLQLVYPLDERVVGMCFDDPTVPAFGTYAAPPVHTQGEREP